MIADKLELACAAACRIVSRNASGDIGSWAPQERSPTLVVKHDKHPCVNDPNYNYPAVQHDAAYHRGSLVVAYWGLPSKNPKQGLSAVQIARGNARGANARTTGSLLAPNGWPLGGRAGYEKYQGGEIVTGRFTPREFVALVTFSINITSSGVPPIIVALIPHGR